jgi:Na+-transporting methylmalonyl-CoA/oxaloacetate decarboxylase gamma subunit
VQNLAWGLSITVIGMGLVFALLALLWALLAVALRLDRPAPAPAAGTDGGEAEVDAGIPPEIVAAITVAVLAHVAARRREAAPLARHYWPGSLLFASRWVDVGRSRQNRNWRRGR